MKIPNSFILFGEQWTVEFKCDSENSGNLGWCDSTKNVILIQQMNFGKEVPWNKQVATFYHELAHAIMITGGFFDLEGDEHFISVVGGLFHQFIDTKSHEIDDSLPF